MRDVLLIANGTAGVHEAAVSAARVLGRYVAVETRDTTGPEELRAILAGRGDRMVVVAGGDGSLHAVVAALHDVGGLPDTEVGLIPSGTGNDFARTVGIPFEPSAAAEALPSGTTRALDLLVDDTGSVVVNAVHGGAGAVAAEEARPWKARFGKVGYAIGTIVAGVRSEGVRVSVVADDSVIADGQRRVLQFGIGNGARIGGGVALAPSAQPGDGMADVLVSFAVSPGQRLLYALRLRRGTHEERHDVHVLRAQTIEVSGAEFTLVADGEVTRAVTARRWHLEPGALTMRLPTTRSRSG